MKSNFINIFGCSNGHVLIEKIKPAIKKQNTHWREAITPQEQLAVCLR